MQTKTYFANNVPAALEVARQELGADALLVDSKLAPPHSRKYGRLEVTFAWDPSEATAGDARAGEAVLANRQGFRQVSRAPELRVSELDDIRQQIASLRVAAGGVVEPVRGGEDPVTERLRRAGMAVETAREIAGEVSRANTGRTNETPRSAVVQILASRMKTASFVEMKAGESRTLAFIGPPGRGKTTSLVKVAVRLGLGRHIPVRIYSVGAHGIGGQEQIARYAAILGTPYQCCDSVESLNLALNGDGWKGLALIDTPGISPSDRSEIKELGRFFSSRPEIEKHLVLRSDARSADMLHVISRFAGLQPSRLLFTGLDESLSAGAVAETMIQGGVPATFIGTGPQIPEDLEEADTAKIARDVWAGSWVEAPAETRQVAAAA